MNNEDIKKITDFINSKEGDDWAKRYFINEKRKEARRLDQATRLYNLIKGDFNSFVNKVYRKSYPYGSRELIKDRLFKYATVYGKPVQIEDEWPTDSFLLNDIVFSVTYGQGSFYWIKDWN